MPRLDMPLAAAAEPYQPNHSSVTSANMPASRSQRRRAMLTYCGLSSIPTESLPSRSATSKVVPDPANGSRITLFALSSVEQSQDGLRRQLPQSLPHVTLEYADHVLSLGGHSTQAPLQAGQVTQ